MVSILNKENDRKSKGWKVLKLQFSFKIYYTFSTLPIYKLIIQLRNIRTENKIIGFIHLFEWWFCKDLYATLFVDHI